MDDVKGKGNQRPVYVKDRSGCQLQLDLLLPEQDQDGKAGHPYRHCEEPKCLKGIIPPECLKSASSCPDEWKERRHDESFQPSSYLSVVGGACSGRRLKD